MVLKHKRFLNVANIISIVKYKPRGVAVGLRPFWQYSNIPILVCRVCRHRLLSRRRGEPCEGKQYRISPTVRTGHGQFPF